MSGTGRGNWNARGTPAHPLITVSDIVVDQPSLAHTLFDRLTGRLVYGERFQVRAEARDVPLELLDPVTIQYARIRGHGNAVADISGRLVEGQVKDLAGTMRASTAGLRLNDE